MKTSKNMSMVEPDELSQLTQQGVKRAIDAQSQQLSLDEVDQVTGGIFTGVATIVVPKPVLTSPFPLGIYYRDLFGRNPLPGKL